MTRLTSLLLGGALVALSAANVPAQTPKDNPKCEANPVFIGMNACTLFATRN